MLSNHIPNYDSEIDFLRQIGTSGFILAFNMSFRGPEHLHSEYPQGWRDQYEERNYFFVDPVLVWIIGNSGTRRWSEINLPDIRKIMPEAAKFGMKYGVAFSAKVKNKRSFLTLSRPDRELTDAEIHEVNEKFQRWAELVVGDIPLTHRELEVLNLLRHGKVQSEIASELGLSESAVKQRFQKACSKLQAKTRAHAVAIAVSRNYFDR